VSSWDATYRRLRIQYVRNATGRIERTERALTAVGADPSNATALTELHREFHGFAGSGRIYGFADVSAIGRDGERDVAALITNNESPSPAALARLHELLDRLRALFDDAASELGSNDESS
jgi:chemotaxis protein histidine kinase CheA